MARVLVLDGQDDVTFEANCDDPGWLVGRQAKSRNSLQRKAQKPLGQGRACYYAEGWSVGVLRAQIRGGGETPRAVRMAVCSGVSSVRCCASPAEPR